MNLTDYDEIDVNADTIPEIGDIVYHPGDPGTIELVVSEATDLIQEEFYPMLLNFGCLLLRKKDES